MGIRDAQVLLNEARALSGAGTTVSTHTMDLALADNGFDVGEPMCVEISVLVAAVGTGTYVFNPITSAAEGLGTPTILTSRTILAAALTEGSQHIIPLPPGAIAQRYLGLQHVLGATDPAITITAHVVPLSMVERRKSYPDAITIS